MAAKQNTPGWSDVKGRLKNADHAGLMSLLQDLYASSKDNHTFRARGWRLGEGEP